MPLKAMVFVSLIPPPNTSENYKRHIIINEWLSQTGRVYVREIETHTCYTKFQSVPMYLTSIYLSLSVVSYIQAPSEDSSM